ncbi:MAG: hypothetical protein GX102_04075 [Porphyromonadaceae bacterium]|nr:hypothetical protein [Porphyromonadaceae bacterium]
MSASTKGIYLELPVSDFKFFTTLAKKMGWNVKTKKNILDSFIESRPKDIEISDDEILDEIYDVRYKK